MSTLPNPNDGYWYGGAIKISDANNVAYLGGIAARDKLPSSDPARFRFEVHRINGDGSLTPLPLDDGDLSGRGALYVDQSTGQGRYTSTNGKTSYDGPIPGFAPFPTPVALEAQIAQLQQTIAHLPPTVTGPTIRVPAQGGVEGGEIQLSATDGGPPWCIDVYAGYLRLHRAGKVVAQWTI